MFAVVYGMDHYMFAGLVLILSLAAGRQAGRLAFSSDRKLLLLKVRRLHGWLVCAGAAGLLRIAVLGAIGIHDGWLPIRDKILFILPLIVLPAIAIAVFTMPRLAAIASRVSANADAPLTPKDLRAATDPGLVFPVRFAAVCGALGFWLSLASPHAPFWREVVYMSLVLAASGLWLWLKCRVLFDEAVLRPRYASRLMQRSFTYLAVFAAAGIILWS